MEDYYYLLDTTKDPSPLMNIDVEGVTFRVFDMKDLRGMSGVVTTVLATLQAIGEYCTITCFFNVF